MMEELATALAAAATRCDRKSTQPMILYLASSAEGRRAAIRLASDPSTVVVDTVLEQLDELVRSREPRLDLSAQEVRQRIDELLSNTPMDRFGHWVYFPWSARLVHVLPRALHQELRVDRNRYKISPDEQSSLLSLRIAIAGLSVGRAVLSMLVREGIGGTFHLADFDSLSLSNLNRISGGIVDIGTNKTVLAAREVVELDPWISVVPFFSGVTSETVGAFLADVDILVDECDDLAMKYELREAARERGIPVVMATSDRGRLDVERFDLEPERPPLHGILPGIRSVDLRGLPTRQKVPYVLRLMDAERLEARMAASLLEVKETIATWPQLASAVALGGAMVAHTIRRITLGDFAWSGRHEVDLEVALREETRVPLPKPAPWLPIALATAPPTLLFPPGSEGVRPSDDEVRFIVRCATLAPSGGNAQPWRFEATASRIRCKLDTTRRPSFLDFAGRASILALGAALEAACIGAEALGFEGRVGIAPEPSTWSWELTLHRRAARRGTPELDRLRRRCCNRSNVASGPISTGDLKSIEKRGGQLAILTIQDKEALEGIGRVLASLDQVRFLSPRMHAELVSELRWTREEALERRDGIDLAALQLDSSDVAALEVLRSGATMQVLRKLGLGSGLLRMAEKSFRNAGAAMILATRRSDHAALVQAGQSLLRVWLEATELDIDVHPWGSPFLFQHLANAGNTLGMDERSAVLAAARAFKLHVAIPDDEIVLLVLRLSRGPAPTARSIRREPDDVLTFQRGGRG